MAVVQDHEDASGSCPKCGRLFDKAELDVNARGHLSDGLLFIICPNCQEDLTVRITFVWSEVLS